VIEDKFNRETGVIELLKGDWIEWSPVNFAANDATLTVGAKSGGDRAERTEHIYVVHQPQDFVDGSYKRDVREHEGKSYTVITGTLRASGNTEEASIRLSQRQRMVEARRTVANGWQIMVHAWLHRCLRISTE
jgi:hypothetical protein